MAISSFKLKQFAVYCHKSLVNKAVVPTEFQKPFFIKMLGALKLMP